MPPLPETGPWEVRNAARSFNAMRARLERYLQERSHLLAALSHDLKTPITRMRLRTEMMPDGDLRDKTLRDLAEMEEMAAASMDFIRGMEGGEHGERVDLAALLESIQGEHEELGRDVVVHCEVQGPVVVKPRSIKRCLDNLISNAVAYGQRARVEARLVGRRLIIAVEDDGPGIPPADVERVFEPFVRLESSRNRQSGGTGLGLPIARNIARAHGGEVYLRNRREGGLTAVVEIPLEN
ncbi:MAG: hypothetical protein HQL51_16905 [Magnetococcales bacterium]|nr:hypothetical protein [Magnetococcales bacterium]